MTPARMTPDRMTPDRLPLDRLSRQRAIARRTFAVRRTAALAGDGVVGIVRPFVVSFVLALPLALLLALPRPTAAQSASGPQFEGRVDLVVARTTSLQGAVALNVPAGRYVRLGGAVGAGPAWYDGGQRVAARADLLARFLLDPFRESPIGLYGIGGLSAMYDGFEHTHPRLLIGVGAESRPSGRHIVAAELALGGGVRIAVVVRRARRTGR